KWVRRIGSLLGVLWFDVFGIRKKVIKENLDIAFPKAPDSEKMKCGRRSVLNLGAKFLEVLTIPRYDQKWLKENIVLEGHENLLKAEAQGKGVYLLSMHLGNGDTAATSIVMSGHKLHLITKTFKNKLMNTIWFQF